MCHALAAEFIIYVEMRLEKHGELLADYQHLGLDGLLAEVLATSTPDAT